MAAGCSGIVSAGLYTELRYAVSDVSVYARVQDYEKHKKKGKNGNEKSHT